MRVIAFDPAMANAAAAVFDLPRRGERGVGDPDGILAAARALVDTSLCKTSPRHSDSYRCGVLAEWARSLVEEHAARFAFIEMPAKAGLYQRVKRHQRTAGDMNARQLAQMNRGIGAVIAGAVLAGADVVEVAPTAMRRGASGKTSKEQRRDILNAQLRRLGRPELHNLNITDAAFAGLMVVADWDGGASAEPRLARTGRIESGKSGRSYGLGHRAGR